MRCSCGLLNNERTPDGKKYYYLFDGLGSIVGMTDSSGSEVNRYDYDPYGNMLNQQEQSGLNNPWKFAGGYLDSTTGLYHFGARYYDPSLGRWTQQDPVGGSLGNLASANRYVYANDDSVNEVDPSGKLSVTPIIVFIPVGVIVNLTSTDLSFFSTPIGAVVAGGLGLALSYLINLVAPGLGVASGILTAYIIAYAGVIKQNCPNGANITYDIFTPEPSYTCA